MGAAVSGPSITTSRTTLLDGSKSSADGQKRSDDAL